MIARRLLGILLIGALGLLPVTAAPDVLWVALVKADNVEPCEDARLLTLEPRLKAVFGFDGYHLLHDAQIPVGERYAQWVLPRKDFYLKVEPVAGSGVRFELYRHKTLLVDGKVFPAKERPLFIAGPDFQDGRLIFLIQRHAAAPTK